MPIPKHIRARCGFIAFQIERGIPLEPQQARLIASIFRRIERGEDPTKIFLGKRVAGQRIVNEEKTLVIQQVVGRIAEELALARREKRKLTVTQACIDQVKFAKRLIRDRKSSAAIGGAQIKRWWDTKKYQIFRKPYEPLSRETT